MNDLIRPRFDPRAVVADIEAMHIALRNDGATVLSFTLPTPGPGMPLARLIAPRVARFNAALRASAARTGTLLLDLGATPVAADPRMWSTDRLHANAAGHERIAAGLAHTLGLAGFEGWSDPLPPAARRPVVAAMFADLAWARTHLAPWVVRHLRGYPSGDGVGPKRPEPVRVTG
jgi:hypothetical protein